MGDSISMNELTFSVADHFADAEGLFQNIANAGFRADVHVRTQTIPWQIMWSFLQRSFSDVERFDVSEVGSTWVGSYQAMDALHYFTKDDLSFLGGADRFIPSAWKSTSMMNDTSVLAVPLLTDTRVTYYWKDMLQEAGVDESQAFDTPSHMEDTLAKLSAAKKPTLAVPTFAVTNTVHQIASWIWATGSEFLSEDAVQTEFAGAKAIEGIIAYFNLSRYLTRKYDSLDLVHEVFEDREAAVMISGPWFMRYLNSKNPPPEYLAKLGVALPPGPSFVGGSNLVMWKHAKGERKKIKLDWVTHLTTTDAQRSICLATGLLPAAKELLTEAPYSTDPHYRVFVKALETGRPLPQVPFWGAIEAALIQVFGNIWSDLKEDPQASVRSVVSKHLGPMAEHYDDKLYRHSVAPHRPF